MLNSTVLDVAVGFMFVFLAFSLTVSAVVEAIASAMKWRSTTLLDGVKQLLNDDQFTGLALSIYNHGLVNPLATGTATSAGALTSLPAYIDPNQFADALIDITKIGRDTPANMNAAIDANVTNAQLKGVLKGIVDRTSGDLVQVHRELAKWFDSSMDRVSGVYKRKTQLWSFLIALAAAAFLNVNSVEVGKALWKQPMLAKTIAPRADETPAQVLDALDKLPLPVGWTKVKWASLTPGMWSDLFVGWLITAFATLFGAPFWFDALQQIVRLKGTGPSPANKISGNAAAG